MSRGKPVASESPYSVHPGVATVQDWIASLADKTGRSLEQWLGLIKKAGPKDQAGRREWLRREHGLGTNAAGWLAERAEGKGAEDSDPAEYLVAAVKHVDAMFGGAKAGLRPLYDELLSRCLAFNAGVKACPCKTMVPLYREHVIAHIKPATRTRIDFGLALGAMMKSGKPRMPSRLIDTGGFAKKDRITHRITVQGSRDIDDDLMKWFGRAFELDA
ncbi:MAG: DUF5655 domain-containing protein [Phycisphaerales bacterium]